MLKLFKRLNLLLVCLACSLNSCSKQTNPKEQVLAVVGDDKITVKEFRLDYEFGFPHLKTGTDRKKTYLDYMIKESILTQEGYKRGLDKTERVQNLEKDLLEELLVEELYQTEISDKINPSKLEIQEAIAKSKVKWKLAYWVEPNYFYANRVYLAMKEHGFAETLDDIFKSNPKVYLKPTDFETDYLSWIDVSEDVLDAIQNLPVGDISKPINLNGQFYIFKIIDIKREPVAEYDFLNEEERYRNLLYHKSFKKAASKYVYDFMTPKNVVTKRGPFQKLADAVAEWKQTDNKLKSTFLDDVKNANNSTPYLLQLKNSLDITLVEFKGGEWRIGDFLNRFNPNIIKAESEENETFLKQLNEQIALSVRDFFLAEKAKSLKLHNSKNVQKQLDMWRDKFVYEEMKTLIVFDDVKGDHNKNAGNTRAQYSLLSTVDSLKTFYTIKINTSVLDTITTIDSEKSRWHSVQVFKKSNNRLALPVVDPAWGF